MKKFISCLLVISALLLCSCGQGVSVSYIQIRNANAPGAVLVSPDARPAYKETLTYYNADGSADYSYSVYIEDGGNNSYNIRETAGDYSLYAYDGEIYAQKNGKLYSVLQASGTYYEYLLPYLTFDCGYDRDLMFYQLFSEHFEENGKEMTRVAYYADITPSLSSTYSGQDITLGDRIVTEYKLNGDFTAESVTYSLRKDGAPDRLLLVRSFEYYTEKQDVFSSLPDLDETVTVSVIYYAGTEKEYISEFKVPSGIGIGIDTAGKNISFYNDSELSVPFDFNSAVSFDDMKIFAVYN